MAAEFGLDQHRNTLSRIESGDQGIKKLQLDALCSHYKLSSQEKSDLHSLRLKSNERGWWEPYFDSGKREAVNPAIPLFLENEQIAAELCTLEESLIPGLLQTSEYLEEIQQAHIPQPPNVTESARTLRSHRQKQIFERENDEQPVMSFLIGAGAIQYLEAMPDSVRKAQRAHLHEMSQNPNIDIRVITSIHAGSAGSFTVLTPPEDRGPIVYIESVDGCRYIESPEVVSLYRKVFSKAYEKTVPLEQHLPRNTR